MLECSKIHVSIFEMIRITTNQTKNDINICDSSRVIGKNVILNKKNYMGASC
jgi:hypothetical protein